MTPENPFILTLSCRDTKGIVHAVSGLLYQAGCNIIDSQQFGDLEGGYASGYFFMRVHFEAPPQLASAGTLGALFEHTLAPNFYIGCTTTMPKRPPPATANSPDDVEAALYEALQRGDLEALMAVWADDDEIVCVHPGGGRVVGAGAIRASFEAIFSNGGIPVQVDQVHRLEYLNSALHHLVEKVKVAGPDGQQQVASVITTNFYVKTPHGWRLASHHASPGTLQPQGAAAAVAGDGPNTLH